ncbi:MAG TPA: hypothetical protein VF142_14435, partial [Longimicrobium sp.]
HRVVVLGPAGAVLRTVGRRGEGPGEYRMIRNVQALPGDSLLVYDPELARVTVYGPGAAEPAYTVALGGKLTRGVPFTLRRTSGNDAFLAVLRPGFAFGQGAQNTNRRERVLVLGLDGRERRELVDYPPAARLVAGTSIMQHPFGRDGFARLDSRDRLHFLWADSLAVTTYGLDGVHAGGFRHAYSPPPVTREDVADALAGRSARTRAQFEPVLADSTPDRWPVAREMLVDEQDRLWLSLGGPTREPTEWAAFSTDGDYLGSMVVPPGVEVRVIRGDGTVYAGRTDDDDVAHVVVYRMARPLR